MFCLAERDLSLKANGPLPGNLPMGTVSLLIVWVEGETGRLAQRTVG